MSKIIKQFFYDRNGVFKMAIIKSPAFILMLVLKLVAAATLGSHFLTKLFSPFVKFFVYSGFYNPYEYFYHLGSLDMFPYPKVMLWILSVPMVFEKLFAHVSIATISSLDIFILRLPILLADLVIFTLLIRWFEGRQKKVLWYYWFSPILFYINYVHGQLDAIPIMFLFVFLYLLFKEHFTWAMIAFGLAISTKTGMLVVLPFIGVYLLAKKIRFSQLAYLLILPFAIFLLFNFDYIQAPGFVDLVMKTKEQFKLFDFQLPYNSNLVLYVIPFAYLLLFAKSLSYKTFNRDLYVMFLGFAFSILTLFIPPMQGWYYWVIPFLVYFYIKSDRAPVWLFVSLNVAYFTYFAIIQKSDYLEVFSLINNDLSTRQNLFAYLTAYGVGVGPIVSLVFSLLQGVLLINVYWIYRTGVENYLSHKIYYQPYLIGVAGDSGSGKSTLAQFLADIFNPKNVEVFAGDDMHNWERGHEMWQKYTHLDPRANDLYKELTNAKFLRKGETVDRRHYDHATGKFTTPQKMSSKNIVIFEGLHSLFLGRMRKFLDLKIYLNPDDELRRHWKIIRDANARGHSRETILEQINKRSEDAEKYVAVQEKYADVTIAIRNQHRLGEYLGQEDAKLDLYLEITCSNDVDLRIFMHEVSSYIEVSYLVQDQKQVIKLAGVVSREVIESLAHKLVPEIDELTLDSSRWSADLDGLIKLFVGYYIFEEMKQSKHD